MSEPHNLAGMKGISSDYARKMPQGKYKAEYKSEHRNAKKKEMIAKRMGK